MEPKNGRPSLTPLGAPRFPGLGRRPKWSMPSTPSVVAANVWRAIDSREDTGREPTADYMLLQHHEINRTGFRDSILWQSRDEALLRLTVRKQWDDFHNEIGAWQQNPLGPQPRRPSVTLASLHRVPLVGATCGSAQPLSSSLCLPPLDVTAPYCSRPETSSSAAASASSCGAGGAPLVATSLRELRGNVSALAASGCGVPVRSPTSPN